MLDGELVYNRLTSSYVFLVFDCLFWGSDALVQVTNACKQCEQACALSSVPRPASYLVASHRHPHPSIYPTTKAPFNTRLRAIHQRVLPLYEQAVAKGVLAPGRHLPLVGKKFYRRAHIAQCVARA